MRAITTALLLLLTGCTTVEVALRPPPPDPQTLMPALEQRIAVLIADERSRIDPNAKSLMIDPELSDIARKRAADMAAKNYFAHTAPNGDTSATLLMSADARFQGLLGENMAAQHYTPALGVDVDKFARAFVDTWLKSAPHKENLSFPDYNRTGVGAAVNGDTVYVTQLFATDLGLGPHQDNAPPAVVTPLPNARAARTLQPTPKPALRGSEGTH
ncbi:MAG TPA: CAP domain-containing protein [Rhizomicrobium sp.]|nr:CAP domain-containing protein [Rhizomicrobium sp.]